MKFLKTTVAAETCAANQCATRRTIVSQFSDKSFKNRWSLVDCKCETVNNVLETYILESAADLESHE